MKKRTAIITELSSKDALTFLLQSPQYQNFELPEYFDFDKVLGFVKNKIGDKTYDQCIKGSPASDFNDVNFDILLNKDGKYAIRPLTLCNPYLYYFLAREICGKDNWEKVKENFNKCTVPHIKCCAMPVIPEKGKEKFHNSTTILNWWNSMEQRAIELSLEYRYMFVTDITNCYGSINPQTIDWALSRKNTKHPTEENHAIACNIIRYLKDFQQGRNIGIPQGSTLFDIIGEIILCYSDLLLSEAIEKEGITEDYEILRYRDDYKVFCNSKSTLEKISYIVQQILESLNFRMNSSKTFISDSIVTDTIKPDKLFYIFNTPISGRIKGYDFDSIQKEMLFILLFGRKHPNSGQMRTLLSQLDKRIEKTMEQKSNLIKFLTTDKGANNDTKVKEKKRNSDRSFGNICAMSAICVQIAIENVAVTHYALLIISRMVNSIQNKEEKKDIITKVQQKLINQPNSTYSKIWIQNMTLTHDIEENRCPYDTRLCRLVMGENITLWNNSWLKPELTKAFPQSSVVNAGTLKKVGDIITFRERRAYEELMGYDND